jgi:asparagine synthase (glutamine-hydrolysing)
MDIVDRLAGSLNDSMKELIKGFKHVAVAFSGGLDSSIMAFYSSRHTSPMLYVAGEDDSIDFRNARHASEVLSLPLFEIKLTEGIVKESLPRIIQTIKSTNPVLVSYKLPVYLVAEAAKEEVVFLGSGADELFGGYSRYERMSPEELVVNMQSDFEDLLREEIPLDERISHAFRKRFEYPFLSAGVVEAALDSPIELKVGQEGRKAVLRKVAERIGLPVEISERKKKAAQYGTGTIKLMRRIAKQDGMSISRYVEKCADF